MNVSNSKKVIQKIKLPENLPAELYVFPLLSGYESYKDYQNTPQKNKSNSLKLDLFVLSGTTLGIIGGYKSFGAMFKNTKKMGKIKSDIIQTIGAPLGGIVTGFFSGYFGSKLFPLKPVSAEEIQQEKHKQKNLVKKTITDRKKARKRHRLNQLGIFCSTATLAVAGNRASRWALTSKTFQNAGIKETAQKFINIGSTITGALVGLSIGDKIFANKEVINFNTKGAKTSLDFILTETSPSLGGFRAGREQSLKDRVKGSFYEIVSAVIVPSAIMLPIVHTVRSQLEDGKPLNKSLKFLDHVSTNPTTKKFIAEKAIIGPVAVGAYLLGNHVGHMFNKHVTQKLLEQDFWDDFDNMRKEIIKSSMDAISSDDKDKKEEAIKQLSEIREMEKRAKENFSSNTPHKNSTESIKRPPEKTPEN